MKPRIAITMGDPAGVGPEVCARIFTDRRVTDCCVPIIFGDLAVLRNVATALQLDASFLQTNVIAANEQMASLRAVQTPTVCDFGFLNDVDFVPGALAKECGNAAYQYVRAAIDATRNGLVDAITTAPLNKQAMHLAGHRYPGHTEILAELTNSKSYCMMQYSEPVTCSFVTTHVGYRDVPSLLSQERIEEVIEVSRTALKKINGNEPQLVVCGLNPHAGENGLFGDSEEERFIVPAIERARSTGVKITGPLPPDTCFLPKRRAETDCFICMYHDQGHIPLKALAFDSAVNVTLGLPFIRTSVDHGTAFDIAWKGVAEIGSMIAAIQLAAQLSKPS